MKKRNAVEKYLKKDIADLLRNGLDTNAYGRVIFDFLTFFLFEVLRSSGQLFLHGVENRFTTRQGLSIPW